VVRSPVEMPAHSGGPSKGGEAVVRLPALPDKQVARDTGTPGGDGVTFWLEAERELSQAK
jgi:hypothetical protein